MRYLEIGPGGKRIKGFETVNIWPSPTTDTVADARRLPFDDHAFDIVYASHCIEHIHWYQVEGTLAEWARVLKPGGQLEVWTIDGYKVARALVQYEEQGTWNGPPKQELGWKEKYVHGDPYKWFVGSVMSYSKGGEHGHHNLHRALLTPRYLTRCFREAGLTPRRMDPSEVRGSGHGWLNMGVAGAKPC